jgi:diacylglycerol O-acyltransferase / wax synthase
METQAYHHQRLSAVDAVLLDAEDRCNMMHVAAVLVFEGGPLRAPDGSLDVDRLRQHVGGHLKDLPRYRQRVRRVPLLNHPVWVDDAGFDLHAHVRPVSLPRPGGESELKAFVGAIVGEPLDRRHPLWELYVVDGLEEGRFAIVAKVHHCIVDGVLGVAVLASLLNVEPIEQVEPGEIPPPRPASPAGVLLEHEIRHRGARTAEMLHRGRRWLRHPTEGRQQLRQVLRGFVSYAKSMLPASVTPFNPGWVGPRRRFDWVGVDLDRVKGLKRRGGCTVNDVVVAAIAGAVRRHLIEEGLDPERLVFRVMVPVSQHVGAMDLSEGNRVSLMVAPLPIDEPDPARRLARTVEALQEVKQAGQAHSLAAAEDMADWTTSELLAETAHRVMRLRPFNMIVTNVPGPPMPLYLLGARLLEAYPMVPLFVNTAVGVAVLSYAGRVGVGVNADPESMRRPEAFVRAIAEAFDELEVALPVKGEGPVAADGPSTGTPHPQRG